MALVDLKNITKEFDIKKILDGVNLVIERGERVAVVGQNGAGKSTLLKIATGSIAPDSGEVTKENNITIQILEQNPALDESLSVKAFIEQSLLDLVKAKQEYEQIAIDLTSSNDKKLLNRLTELTNLLDFHNAWNLDERVKRTLDRFDLKRLEDMQIATLSGGERRRVALSALLLKKPDLLLLDEPTNHLDLYMVRFLEEMLVEGGFTLLFISHDRYFIDQIATRVIEVEEAKIHSFRGGYADYLEQKERLLSSMQRSHEQLLKRLKSEQEWLSRGVKARVKRNMGRVERIKQMKAEAQKNPAAIRKIKLQLEREQKNFNQDESINRKKMLFEVENLSVKLGENRLIENFSARIMQSDKIAVVGRNGTGKSTLLKVLLGDLIPTNGKIKKGEYSVGYYDQHKTILDDDKSLMETFCPNGGDTIVVRGKNMHVYGYLKNWLFPKEFLDKKIGFLSGGEKSRVALALIFSKKYDLLILDEPTNDLDIPTINILEEYLQSFTGAIIFVSHDRYFVDKIAKKLLVFKGAGSIEESVISYSEYLENEEDLVLIEEFSKQAQIDPKPDKPNATPKQKLSYKENRLYESLPAEIEKLENEIKDLEQCLMSKDCYEARGGLESLYKACEALKAELDGKIETYLEIEDKIEQLKLLTNKGDE